MKLVISTKENTLSTRDLKRYLVALAYQELIDPTVTESPGLNPSRSIVSPNWKLTGRRVGVGRGKGGITSSFFFFSFFFSPFFFVLFCFLVCLFVFFLTHIPIYLFIYLFIYFLQFVIYFFLISLWYSVNDNSSITNKNNGFRSKLPTGIHPFILLGGEKHCESKVPCPRTQPSDAR